MYKLLIALGGALLVAWSAEAAPAPQPATTGEDQETDVANKFPIAPASAYLRHCGICHLDAGQGVPGAFPPLGQRLAGWAQQEAGRKYLTGVVANGLYGVIQVDGQQYAGAMPGLGTQLSSTDIAGLLNYVLVEFGGSDAIFTGDLVESDLATLGSGPSLPLRPNE